MEVRALASRAQGELRSFGYTELAFSAQSDAHLFGTFQELKDSLYLAGDYVPSNIIRGYTLICFLSQDKKEFAAVALPTEHAEILSPYMIQTSQMVSRFLASQEDLSSEWKAIVDAEAAVLSETGEYNWVPAPDLAAGSVKLELFLSDDKSAYLILQEPNWDSHPANVQANPIVYLSTTGLLYSREPTL